MNRSMDGDPLDCVALMLLRDNRVLAERRKTSKRVMPGALAIPGGHVEAGETAEQALRREAEEELGIEILDPRFVCTLLHRSQEFRRLSYFAATAWRGEIACREAEALTWQPLAAIDALDLDVDRLAIGEYLRVFQR